jgi:hypothetical protein
MRIVAGFMGLAIASTACSSESRQQSDFGRTQIPEALHGCWELREPASEEYPDGLSGTLVVRADHIIVEANGIPRRIGTIEKIERLTPKLIEGRISAKEGNLMVTLATALELNPEGSPPNTLLLREGDAASYNYRRCQTRTKAAQRQSR